MSPGALSCKRRSRRLLHGLEINQNVNYALKIGDAKSMLGSSFHPPAPTDETPKTREAMVKSVADAVALIRAQ